MLGSSVQHLLDRIPEALMPSVLRPAQFVPYHPEFDWMLAQQLVATSLDQRVCFVTSYLPA